MGVLSANFILIIAFLGFVIIIFVAVIVLDQKKKKMPDEIKEKMCMAKWCVAAACGCAAMEHIHFTHSKRTLSFSLSSSVGTIDSVAALAPIIVGL